jgi:hypothetical protein
MFKIMLKVSIFVLFMFIIYCDVNFQSIATATLDQVSTIVIYIFWIKISI